MRGSREPCPQISIVVDEDIVRPKFRPCGKSYAHTIFTFATVINFFPFSAMRFAIFCCVALGALSVYFHIGTLHIKAALNQHFLTPILDTHAS